MTETSGSHEWIEDYIAGLKWSDATDEDTRGLVAGNLRGLFAVMSERTEAAILLSEGSNELVAGMDDMERQRLDIQASAIFVQMHMLGMAPPWWPATVPEIDAELGGLLRSLAMMVRACLHPDAYRAAG